MFRALVVLGCLGFLQPDGDQAAAEPEAGHRCHKCSFLAVSGWAFLVFADLQHLRGSSKKSEERASWICQNRTRAKS